METKLLYLNDTLRLSESAKIIEIGSDEKGSFMVFDQTVFYPQGGGQPTDVGIVKNNENEFRVTFVAYQNGIVKHYVDSTLNGKLKIGDTVGLKVADNNRINNAKCHSAGHLISSIVEMKLPNILATKGFHFPNGSYIEFDKPINFSDDNEKQNFITEVNSELQKAISDSIKMEAKLVNYNELVSLCDNIPSGIPQDKPLRIASIKGYPPYPCGGTHISNFNMFNKIEITKIKNKKGHAKISYLFS